MAKVGWWASAAVLPVVIWPIFDWSHPIALALTDFWFERTRHMPSWSETAMLELGFVVLCAVASGVALYFAVQGIRRAGAPGGVGWAAAAASALIAIVATRSAATPDFAAMLTRAAPGLAMIAAALAAQLVRR